MNIVIVNYGMGNIGSVLNMFSYLQIEARISDRVDEIAKAEKLVLPGVGAFDNGIFNIKKLGLIGILNEKVLVEKTPVLGICLGMQMMTSFSEEGSQDGLNWIKAKTFRFKFEDDIRLKIPHMGWNYINKNNENEIVRGLDNLSKFYFVHSYYVKCEDMSHSVCTTHYGLEFDSVISKDNVFGCQFHPEKSHKYGMRVLKNFAELKYDTN